MTRNSEVSRLARFVLVQKSDVTWYWGRSDAQGELPSIGVWDRANIGGVDVRD